MADGLCLMFPPLDWQCSATTSTGKIQFFLVMAEVADLFSYFFFLYFFFGTDGMLPTVLQMSLL